MRRSKLPNVGTTIFTVMSKLAAEHSAVNLGQGFPGFAMDQRLCDLVHKYMCANHNQYAPMPGVSELRDRISQKILAMYGHLYQPESEVTITAGGTQAIFTAITAMVSAGDEVILFAPAYDCYAPTIELNGGKPVWINLSYPNYKIDWETVRSAITSRTRMIIINSPHNPSGVCLSADDLEKLTSLVRGTEIVILSDEVYEHIVFDGKRHESVTRYPELASRSFVVYSFGKTFHNTGWKMGYICAPEDLMIEFRRVHQFNVFSCNTPVQYALAEYMADPDTYLGLSNFYQRKRDLFLSHMKNSSFRLVPASGTYFQLLGYDGLFAEDDVALAKRLTVEKGLASIPCSVFYPEGSSDKVLRICFAKEDDLLMKAAAILSTI